MKIPDEPEPSMSRCDWLNCLAIGHFDGVDTTLLNTIERSGIGKEAHNDRGDEKENCGCAADAMASIDELKPDVPEDGFNF